MLTRKKVAFDLIHDVGPRFAGGPGGDTRIYKLAKVRQGDAGRWPSSPCSARTRRSAAALSRPSPAAS